MQDQDITDAQWRWGIVTFVFILALQIGLLVTWVWLIYHPEVTNCWGQYPTEQAAIENCEHRQ